MEVMLAHRGQVADIPRLQQSGHLFDLKIDGVRCVASLDEGHVVLVNRQNRNITPCYPELVAALKDAHPVGRVVLDGEVAVCGSDGLPSWPLTQKRSAQQNQFARWAEHLPATLFVFDVLTAGEDLRGRPFTQRRQRLVDLSGSWPAARVKATIMTTDGEALWDMVRKHQLEGVVAKNPNAAYTSGRSRDWIKIKRTYTASCLVGGFDEGEGSRAPFFGALHLYLLDESGDLVQVGRVGSGFTQANLRRVKAALSHPPLIVEVEYLDVQSGVLRQPVFKGIRDDLDVTACTTAQLHLTEVNDG